MNEIIRQDIESIINRVGPEQFRRLEGKNFLITGPQGLLAAYLVETIVYLNTHYFNEPCEVLGLCRSPVSVSSRLRHLFTYPYCYFPYRELSEVIPFLERCEFIVHAAGRSAPQVFAEDPVGTMGTNLVLAQLLEKARADKSETVLYFSSSEIYGNPTVFPTPETYWGSTDSLGLRSCYTEAKRCGEALCMAYHRQYGVPTKIIRPALVYGPGLALDDKRVLAEFVHMALKNPPIHLRDAGQALRSYCYITDAITLIWRILLTDEAIGEAFNVGNDKEEFSIAELAQMVHDEVGITEKIQLGSQPLSSAPSRVCVSMEKSERFFTHESIVPFREGLSRTIEWMKQ